MGRVTDGKYSMKWDKEILRVSSTQQGIQIIIQVVPKGCDISQINHKVPAASFN